MDAGSLVFGDEISGWGRLIRTGDGEWFDPPQPVAMGGAAWGRPVQPSGCAIPVEGADFDAVVFRTERDGVIAGHTTIYGQWLGDRISVHRQTSERPEDDLPLWSDPPCEAHPTGGRAARMNTRPSTAISAIWRRPVRLSWSQPSDRARIRRCWWSPPRTSRRSRHGCVPPLPDQLCVVASRSTRVELDALQAHVLARWERWGVYGCGRSCDEQAQAVITVDFVRVTEEIARWAQEQLAGLIVLKPCLTPVDVPRL